MTTNTRAATRTRSKWRRRFNPGRAHPLGLAPGELAVPADAVATHIQAISYGADSVHTVNAVDVQAIAALRGAAPVLWVDVVGLRDVALLRELGALFGLHPLALEDAVERGQRPKAVDHADQTVIVVRDLSEEATEQLAIVVGAGFVLTIQERPGDPWQPIRDRLAQGTGRVRSSGSDYLAYSLVDAVIDRYYPQLEQIERDLDALEGRTYDGEDVIAEIASVQKALSRLRRVLWPTREALGNLGRIGRGSAIQPETAPYVRDAYDHAARLVELTESLREEAKTLMDTHIGLSSHRLGESMKVLTTIATIFMPLSFLAGLYGMNFDRASPFNMPELGWRYGYVGLLSVMALLVLALVVVFRRKRWL